MDWAWLRSQERVAPFVPSPGHDPWIPEIAGKVQREEHWLSALYDPYESYRRTPLDINTIASNLCRCGVTAAEVDRITRTVELSFAVRQNDREKILQLLSSGAECNFAKGDYQPPARPTPGDCSFGDPFLHEADFIAPLIYAIGYRNEELVKILLTHGVDSNLAFHGLVTGYCCPGMDQDDALPCGNVVQFAAALRLAGIVDILINAGARVDGRTVPNLEEHLCPGINRILSQRIVIRTALRVP
jgi:hypothetical protein